MQPTTAKPRTRAGVPTSAGPTANPGTIKASTFLKESGRKAAGALDLEKSIAALEEMYEDAFLFGYKAGDSSDGYSFEQRDMIRHAYKGFKAIIPMLSAYGWRPGEETDIATEDYELLFSFMEDSIDMREAVPVLEGMMITSLHYKWVKEGDHPTNPNQLDNIYDTFTLLRALITGYMPRAERQ